MDAAPLTPRGLTQDFCLRSLVVSIPQTPVVGIELVDHDVDVLGFLVEHALQGRGDFCDNLGVLLASDAVLGYFDLDVWH
ncbi:hypothetical protein LBMAG48_15030 [Phycisphaerae bacterium]|nr:hypothetical protein LBMAG48_15030 [Phycisphaerae bacterium]